jgi:Ca2+-binding RTX toxin-like protein
MGKDVLIGGKGQDSFSFNSPKEGVDTIKKFIPKDDTILVSAKGFKRGLVAGTVIPSEQFVLGSTATDSDDRFLYDKATGELFFDSDGSGVKQPVLFAVLTNKPTLTNADIFVGV